MSQPRPAKSDKSAPVVSTVCSALDLLDVSRSTCDLWNATYGVRVCPGISGVILARGRDLRPRRHDISWRLSLFVCAAWLALLPASGARPGRHCRVGQGFDGRRHPRRGRRSEQPRADREGAYRVTDGTGRYRIEDLRPGIYTVQLHAQGLEPVPADGVELTGSFTATVNAELAVGPLTETVTVTGRVPVVDVHSAKHEVTLSGDIVRTIPTVRSYNALLVLVPGVVTSVNDTVTGTATTSFPIHGGRTNEGRLLARRTERRQSAGRQFGDELRRRRRQRAGSHVFDGGRARRGRNRRSRHEHRAQERRQHDARLGLRQRHRRTACSRTISRRR